MNSNEISIILSVICLVLVSHSWYVHFKVKDGIARLMLLWGCGFIFLFLLTRIVNLLSFDLKAITIEQSKTIANYQVWFIYVIVVGQWFIQRGRAERDEDDTNIKDKKELKKRRKAD